LKLLLRIGREDISRPVLAEVILATGVEISIDAAKIDGVSGEIIVKVPDDRAKEIINQLEDRNINVITLDRVIIKDDVECIDCGSCVSVCPVGALRYLEDWSVELDESRCVHCGACITTCPHRALTLEG